MGNLNQKISQAESTLNLARRYMAALAEEAEQLANFSLKRADVELILDAMFPVDEDASKRIASNREQCKDEILELVGAHDLKKFGHDNAWSFLNAVTDWTAHRQPLRQSANYAQNNFDRVTSGHPVLDQAYTMVKTLMKAA